MDVKVAVSFWIVWVFGLVLFFLFSFCNICNGCSLMFNWDVLTLILPLSWMPLAHWVSRNSESCGKGCFSIWYDNNFYASFQYLPAHNPFGVICWVLGGLVCLKILPHPTGSFPEERHQQIREAWPCGTACSCTGDRWAHSVFWQVSSSCSWKLRKSTGLGNILITVCRAQEKWKT